MLTGEPRVGKTTALKKIVNSLGDDRCGGFYTEELCAANERYGFRIRTLDGQTGTLADIAYTNTSLKVGRYGVVLPFLENVGLAAVSNALTSKEFVVIDEIGPMQMFSAKFQQAVLDVLKSSVPLLGSISESSVWLSELTGYREIELFILTEDNRNEIAQTLIEALRDI